MVLRSLSLALVSLGLCAGCAESGNGNAATLSGGGGAGGSVATGGGSDPSSTATGSPPDASGTTGGAGGGAPQKGSVVINEIAAKGGDWIEIANAGPGAADLGGHGLCDDDANGDCDLTTIVRFPAGTMLAAGAHLLIVGNEPADAGVGPSATCLPDAGLQVCFYATWKVSASKGETVHFVDSNNQVLSEAKYPKDAVGSGQTWARLPDITGDFAAASPTPGEANAAP